MDETILKELREIKETLQTIASSLECEKKIDINQVAEELARKTKLSSDLESSESLTDYIALLKNEVMWPFNI